MTIPDYADKQNSNAKVATQISKDFTKSDKIVKLALKKATSLQKELDKVLKSKSKKAENEIFKFYQSWDEIAQKIVQIQYGDDGRKKTNFSKDEEKKMNAFHASAEGIKAVLEATSKLAYDDFKIYEQLEKALKKVKI